RRSNRRLLKRRKLWARRMRINDEAEDEVDGFELESESPHATKIEIEDMSLLPDYTDVFDESALEQHVE
ncbi:hypothetical protein PENTCL1PPCAC_12992, partial [Pristionchus entomophagus]